MRQAAFLRLLCAVLLGLSFCNISLAQDPTKVEPGHYKLAFENEYVQVVNVHYGPHEKSNLHAHMGGWWSFLPLGISGSPTKTARPRRCMPSRVIHDGFRPSNTKWKTSGTLLTTLFI
jgi:hypothetical protein